jgi:beta-lactamase regulating signal transducer with metallopeptidase domain
MEYLIKSTAILSLFYIFYKVFLQNETFFQSIRSYFLIGVLTSFALPLVIIPEYVIVESVVLPVLSYTENISSSIVSPKFDWNRLLLLIYLIGVIFFFIRFLIQLSSLLWLIISHQKTNVGKYIMIKTSKDIAPFSFFNCIVFNPEKFNSSELDQIILHEKIHVNQLHSFDIILSQFIVITNWFNPFIWLYNKEVQKNLEFIADDLTQHFMHEKKTYQYLLLKAITPNQKLILTNNFYNSLIKKRINMLQKNRSNKTMYFKFAFIIPILIAFVFTFNTEIIAQEKKVKTSNVQSDYEVELITKDFTSIDLEKLKTRLASKGITFKFKKLKYNSKNEITSISISVNSGESKANISMESENEAIKPIRLKINTSNNSISLGTVSGEPHMKNIIVSSGDKDIHKKIIVKHMGDGDEVEEIIWISGDSINTFKHKGESGFVFYSDDDQEHAYGKKAKYKVKVHTDSDMHFGDEKGNLTKVYVSEDGDTTKIKKIELIEISEDSGGSHKIIIKKGGSPHEVHDILIESDDKIHSKHGNMLFIDSDGGNPLFIVDDKEVTGKSLKDFDQNNIEKIEILKGDKVVEKYGEKAKDGVILIETKKKK